MLSLVLTNLVRHKLRAGGTAIGIAVGVGTIVALLSVGSGLQRTAGELVRLGQADFGVFQAGVADPTASIVPTSLARRLERREDVARATPLLLMVETIRRDPAAIVFGADPDGFFAQRLVVLRGSRRLGGRRIMVGDQLARRLGVEPGDELRVKRRPFTVAGVYHSGIFFEDNGAVVDLRMAQRLERRGDDATNIVVEMTPGADQAKTERAVRRAFPGTTIIGTPEEAARLGANGELVGKTVTIITALALILGGLGVANTMLMAVLERERELALLNAVGWRRWRVAFVVLAEGVATSALGAVVGLLIGTLGARALNRALDVSSVVTPHLTPGTIAQALAIGLAIGVLGGLYPAWRGTGASPLRLLSSGT